MALHPVDVYVGQRLRLKRSMLGMSQDQLGKKVGITFQQIQKYERGINRIGASRLYEFSRILGTAVAYFFEGMGSSGALAKGLAEDGTKYEAEDLVSLDDKETLALIRAFRKVKDQAVRKKVLDLVKAMGE